MLRSLAIGLLLAPAVASAQSLYVEGICPGTLGVSYTGGSPGSDLVILTGGGPGSVALAGGPCAGTVTGLEGPLGRFIVRDTDGTFAFTPATPAPACGQHLQVLDMATCALSNVGVLGEGNVLYAADGECSGSSPLYRLNTATGVEDTPCALAHSYGGLTFHSDGALYGITDACDGGDVYRIDTRTCAETLIAATGHDEVVIGSAGDELWGGDGDSELMGIDPVAGTATPLGFHSGECCGSSIANDASYQMYWVSGGFGLLDADGMGDEIARARSDQGSTFHNGQLVGLNDGCANLFSYDPITGDETDLGFGFASCNADALASPNP